MFPFTPWCHFGDSILAATAIKAVVGPIKLAFHANRTNIASGILAQLARKRTLPGGAFRGTLRELHRVPRFVAEIVRAGDAERSVFDRCFGHHCRSVSLQIGVWWCSEMVSNLSPARRGSNPQTIQATNSRGTSQVFSFAPLGQPKGVDDCYFIPDPFQLAPTPEVRG